MSNLVKQRFIVSKEQTTRVIDSNEKFQRLMNRDDGFRKGLSVEYLGVSDEAFTEESDGLEGILEDRDGQETSYEDGLEYNETFEPLYDNPEEVLEEASPDAFVPNPDLILENATIEANEIIANAKTEAASIFEEAKSKGYQDGIDAANAEIESMKSDMSLDYENKLSALDESRNQMEEELIEALIPVFEDVLSVEIDSYRDIMLSILRRTLSRMDSNKSITIQASGETYDAIKDSMDSLTEIVGQDTSLSISKSDILTDKDLKIETDYGIFDCSFDTEMRNLTKKIRLLSEL